MTDKVQKIRGEVERLMYGFNLEADIASCEDAETEKLADTKYQLCKKILDYIDKVQEEPVSEEIWEASKQYALRQVLASTDAEMSEQAYLDLRLFSGFELAVAHKDGANWQKNLNKKDFELLKEWFEDISEKCEHLTSGNVSHNRKMIRGYARNCAEYIKTDLL